MIFSELPPSPWIKLYLGVSWFSEIGNGLINTIVGPMQPFLAANVGVDVGSINLLWTFGYFGYLFGCIIAGFVFTKYLSTQWSKMVYLSCVFTLTGLVSCWMPFIHSFGLLLVCRLVQFIGVGLYVAADCILVVHCLGPVISRPFTMALHASIGVGFLLATFLVQPFLPSVGQLAKDDAMSRDLVCSTRNMSQHLSNLTETVSGTVVNVSYVGGVPKIAVPFLMSGVWCMLGGMGYLYLGMSQHPMPVFTATSSSTASSPCITKFPWPLRSLFCCSVFTFYLLSGAVERTFQSMSTTWAMCGPLQLDSNMAALTDSFYNGGFMTGRVSGSIVAGRWLPSTMLGLSLGASLSASLILLLLGSTYYLGLYLPAAAIGFFVSWQFGAGFSWAASKVDVTGKISPLFFLGCGMGSLSAPPVAGALFTTNPQFVLRLVMGIILGQVAVAGLLWFMDRKNKFVVK